MAEQRTYDAPGLPAAIAAALRTGLLAAIAEGPATEPALARRLGLDARALGLILDVLRTTEWVGERGDQVTPGPLLIACGRSPGGYPFSLGLWAHTETFLRTGEPFMLMDRRAAEREAAYRDVVGELARVFEAPARALAARLPVRPRRILDVGCGSGVWSLAVAERAVEAQVTGLDLPAVLEQFTARARSLGLEARTATVPGDMHEVELPRAAFDLVIIANVLRLETPERAERVVRRAAEAVAPEGALLVVDSIAEGTPARERARALYALHLGLRTQSGQVHRRAAISAWLARAGFGKIAALDVGDEAGAMGALLGTRD